MEVNVLLTVYPQNGDFFLLTDKKTLDILEPLLEVPPLLPHSLINLLIVPLPLPLRLEVV